MQSTSFMMSLHPAVRILFIFVIAIVGHLIVKELKQLTQWMLAPKSRKDVSTKESFARRYPKLATLVTVFISAVIFILYFAALGLILKEFNVSLTTYLASASVIGLAIGFGLQGLVQDVVIGLTLIFSDVLSLEDLVEVSGQVGKVERIGLRFTIIVNLHGQRIYLPNRNIGTIGRFRQGHIRAYADIQIPDEADEKEVSAQVKSITEGVRDQHKTIVLAAPEMLGIKEAKGGKWRYLRLKFRLWPGQGSLIETTFKQRMIGVMKKRYPDYADWMITVTYGTEGGEK